MEVQPENKGERHYIHYKWEKWSKNCFPVQGIPVNTPDTPGKE